MRHEAGDCCKFPPTFECLYCISVVADGEHRAWCMERAYSPVEEVMSTLTPMTVGNVLVLAWLLFAVDGGVGQRGIIHNPIRVHLLWQRMTLLRYVILVHPILVKTTLQPALHRVTMEMREWEARPGMIWACCAEAGRAGMSRVHVCLECTRSPFGSRAMIGLLMGRMLVMGATVVKK
jgi:hypothetical protein